MNQRDRDYFDKQVQWVLDRLPHQIHRLLEEVPLHVEDRPPKYLRKRLGVRNPCGLLGCFIGVPLDTIQRRSGNGLPTMITIYRSGICETARTEKGRINVKQLREQIRITILHEVGHYYGMDEEDLQEAGYG